MRKGIKKYAIKQAGKLFYLCVERKFLFIRYWKIINSSRKREEIEEEYHNLINKYE